MFYLVQLCYCGQKHHYVITIVLCEIRREYMESLRVSVAIYVVFIFETTI